MIAMPKHRSKHANDGAAQTQTTLADNRWVAEPSDKIALSTARIRYHIIEIYKEQMRVESTLPELDGPGYLVGLAGLWTELHNHEAEIETTKASLREQMVLIGLSEKLLKEKNWKGFTSSSFDIEGSVPINVSRFDKLRVPEDRKEEYYSYMKSHDLDPIKYTLPSLYLPFKALKKGVKAESDVVHELMKLEIAQVHTENMVRINAAPKKELHAAIRE